MTGFTTPRLWSASILEAMQHQSAFSASFNEPRLEPRDVWALTGENYSEAVALASIAGIGIFKDSFLGHQPLRKLRLHRKGWPPQLIPWCPPHELMGLLRRFAACVPGDQPFPADQYAFVRNP